MSGTGGFSANERVARGILVIVATVLTLGALETGARLRQWYRYGAASTTVYSFAKDPTSGLRVPVPGEIRGSRTWIRINSLGFRGPELEVPKPASRVRLAFLGGSTTFCAEVSRNEMTWPHLVWSRLQAAYPAVQFDYVNGGVPGYGIRELRRNLEYRMRPLSPDIIVIYEATNDLSYDTRKLAEAQGLYTRQSAKQSWLANWSSAWFLVEKNLEVAASRRMAESGKGRLRFDPRELSRGFHEQLMDLARVAKQVAPVVALATFSSKVRRDQSEAQRLKAANSALYYMPYMSPEGLLEGYSEYNRVIREVARETGTILIEDELSIPGDDRHFYDSVHFTDAGSDRMAARVVRFLGSSAPFANIMSARRLTNLDLNGVFAGYDTRTLRLADWDTHPNTAAHRLIAESLYQAIGRHEAVLFAPRYARDPR